MFAGSLTGVALYLLDLLTGLNAESIRIVFIIKLYILNDYKFAIKSEEKLFKTLKFA